MTQKISVFFAGAVLSVFVLSPAFAQTSGTNADADGKESSIWDDDSSGDSRFFTRKKGRTAADIKRRLIDDDRDVSPFASIKLVEKKEE